MSLDRKFDLNSRQHSVHSSRGPLNGATRRKGTPKKGSKRAPLPPTLNVLEFAGARRDEIAVRAEP